MGLFRRRKRPAPTPTPPRVGHRSELDRLTAELQAQAEREAPPLMAEVEREAARMLAKLDAEHPSPPPLPDTEATPARPPAHGAITGPSWMPAEDWASRLDAYRRQGRSDAEMREVARHLEQRGPRKSRSKGEQVERAKSQGLVSRAEYLSPEDEAAALVPGPDGLPDARLGAQRATAE